MKKLNAKTVGTVAAVAGIVVGTVLGAVAFPTQNTVIQTQTVKVPYEVVKNVTVFKEVPVIKNVTIEKFVEVDNGDMDFVLDRLEDKAIIADASEIVEELKAEDSALEMCIKYVKDNLAELFDMLEDKGLVSDEDDVKVIKSYTDFEDVNITKSDFDNEEYSFVIKYKIEDTENETKSYVFASLSVEDGDVTLDDVQ